MKILSFLSFLLAILTPARAQESAPVQIKVKDDLLELRVTGQARVQAATWEWRIIHRPAPAAGEITWHPGASVPDAEGKFEWTLPLEAPAWERLEVRARNGEALVGSDAFPNAFPGAWHLVTPERLAALAPADRTAWEAYLAASLQAAAVEHAQLATECRTLGLRASAPAPQTSKEFEFEEEFDTAWFATPEALALAEVVLSYQTPTGGWSKGVDYTKGARKPSTHWTSQSGRGWHYCGTLDNRATTEQIKFLAYVYAAHRRPDCLAGLQKGLAWLIAAQFPNGGWPQVYPLEPGYHEAITLNDGAMLHALEVLRSVSLGEEPYGFLDEATRQRAAAAYAQGLQCLRQLQVVVEGHRTVWCAQHHPLTLEPVAARLKEPPSLSGAESAEVVRFLMRKGPMDAETQELVKSVLAWFETRRLTGLRRGKDEKGKTTYTEDATCTDPLWARFYDLATGKPMFAGAQDGVVYSTYQEMAQHNKVAYDYFTNKPADLFTKEMARWQKRLAKSGAGAGNGK